jgi:DNA-binding NtrC family response regulator
MALLALVIEDEDILATAVTRYLEHHGFSAVSARSGEEGLRLAEETSPDVAIVDIRLPGMDGLEVLRQLRAGSPATQVIMTTAHASVTSALEAMKLGAFDYLIKPVDLDELQVVVEKAVNDLRVRRELSYLKAREPGGACADLIGESAPMRALRAQIARVAGLEGSDGAAPPSVLVLGETGAGKEMVARAIHHGSARASGPFVEINCAAIPASLLEAELFGYEKGAYTDAKAGKPGLFESADGGTLFLDEIGHMDAGMQVKLLKAIEERSVRRLGAIRTKSFNARIVAATNRDLLAAIAEGAFRADLYYRIHALTIDVPPLRERGNDIILLAEHFLGRYARQWGLPPKTLPPDTRAALLGYRWPGNVRELAHMMERAVLQHGGAGVTVEHIGLAPARPSSRVVVEADGTVLVDFAAGPIVLEDVERRIIVQALEAARWNRGRAAELLGISKETLRYRIEKFALAPPD